MVERRVLGVGSSGADDLKAIATKSSEAMGPSIGWSHSFVTDDALFCVYHSESEDLVREHAVKGGFSITNISVVHTTFDKSILDSSSSWGPNSIGPVNAVEFTADPRSKFMVVRPTTNKTHESKPHAELQMHAKAFRDASRCLSLTRVLWQYSYDTEGGLFEVFIAPSEEMLMEHTDFARFPRGNVSRIKAVISPSTADIS